jgi:monofunctional biosynthetic peptidoglycan transglycosylase
MNILLQKIGICLKRAFWIFIVISVFLVILFRFVNPPLTPLMVIRFGKQIFGPYSYQFEHNTVAYGEISSNFKRAIIAAEDQKFTQHMGFDFDAMQKAFEYNKQPKKKTIKGGSTISQQVAKNIFLWPGRSYLRKGLEAYFTVLIELTWSKKRILELYMNKIEMGNGIYGIESASQFYFQTSASKLTKKQAAMLAAIIPSPRKWNPNKPTVYLTKRKDWILGQINQISIEEIDK